jgi:hypothetical protein
MNFQWFLVLMIAAFVAAPFAGAAGHQRRARVAAAVLLGATLCALGYLAFAFDRGLMPPLLWFGCGACVVMGIGICIFIFEHCRFSFALVLGAVFICALCALHFFGLGSVKICQRVCRDAVRQGMAVADVQARFLREFAESPDYRPVVEAGSLPPNQDWSILFSLRPRYVSVEPEFIMVHFVGGRANRAQATLVRFPPLSIWFALGSVLLCGLCFQRLCQSAPTEKEGTDISAVFARVKSVRAQRHQKQSDDESVVITKRILLHSAGVRVRQLAYFRGRHEGAEMEEKDNNGAGNWQTRK